MKAVPDTLIHSVVAASHFTEFCEKRPVILREMLIPPMPYSVTLPPCITEAQIQNSAL